MQSLYQSWLGHSRFQASDEFRPFELNSHGPFSKYVFVEWVVVMNVILFWGNLITKGGALGYVGSIEPSAPFLHPLFSFSPTPLPSVFPGYCSIQTVLLVLCLQTPGGELWRGCFSIHCFI